MNQPPASTELPRSARIHSYPGPVPDEGWKYVFDDAAITYGPGLWPFYRQPADPFRYGTSVAQGRPVVPSSARFSPDSQFYAWGDWYLTISPPRDPNGEIARIFTSLRVQRPETWPVYTVATWMRLDLKHDAVHIHEKTPEPLREIAELKAARILEAFLDLRAERDSGAEAPVTAHQLYTEQQQREEYGPLSVTLAALRAAANPASA